MQLLRMSFLRLLAVLWAVLPATAWAQEDSYAQRTQWWSIGSLVFFVVVIGALIYLTAKANDVHRPRRS